MNYKDKYNKLVEAIKVLQETNPNDEGIQNWVNDNVSELKESEDERIRKEIIRIFKGETSYTSKEDADKYVIWLEKQKKPEDKGEISDGYHTFNELYRYRMLYNAAFFNLLPKYMVHKSKRHHDGKECFGGGWFIVIANLPTGQISNHYELKDWDLFQVPEKYIADEWDGHTPQEAADRLHKYLLKKQSEQKVTAVDFKAKNWYVSKVDGKIYDATYVEQKFHEGDNVVSFQMYGKVYTVGPTHYVTGGDNICLYDTDRNYKWTNRDDLARNYRLWTIKDARKGDVLEFEDHEKVVVGVVSYVNKRTGKVDVSCLLEDNKFKIGNFYALDTINPHPATKEQRDTLMKAMTDAGYIFDFEKKELKRIEQNTSDKVESKFHEGDWVVWDNKISCHIDNIYQGKESLMYTITDINNMTRSYSVKGFDNNAHLWTIQDAKDGDVLHSIGFHGECIFIFNGLDKWRFDEPNGDRAVATGYCCLTLSDSNMEFGLQGPDCIEVDTVHPSTKVQRDLLFQKMKEAGYEWDVDNKELKKIE